MGKGSINMARSVAIQGIGVSFARRFLLPQCARTDGSQLFATGMQIKVSARTVPIHHRMMTTPRIQVQIRNEGVMKMRWKSIKTEILVIASRVGSSPPTVYQSWSGQHARNSWPGKESPSLRDELTLLKPANCASSKVHTCRPNP